jgi:hypothetical protein
MTTEALQTALAAAKNLYDHGKFSVLAQAEFFKAMEAGLAEPDPPPEEDAEAEATKTPKAKIAAKSTKG